MPNALFSEDRGSGLETHFEAPRSCSDLLAAHIVHVAYKLLGLFESGRGYNSRCTIGDALPLALPVLRGSLRLRMRRVPRPIVLQAGEKIYRDSPGEGAEHKGLKAAAILWMRSQGAKDAREEATCFVRRADAYSDSQKWAVECGNTPVTKLGRFIDARQREAACRFAIIPYQRNGYDERVRGLIAIEFEASADASADVSAYQTEMVANVLGSANEGRRPPRPSHQEWPPILSQEIADAIAERERRTRARPFSRGGRAGQ